MSRVSFFDRLLGSRLILFYTYLLPLRSKWDFFPFFRLGWNLNVLPHLPGSLLKHLGFVQGENKKLDEANQVLPTFISIVIMLDTPLHAIILLTPSVVSCFFGLILL